MASYKPLECTLVVGELVLHYTWARKSVKNYNMRVRRDGTVYVSTPTRTTRQQLERFITDRAEFLRRALARVAQRRGGDPLSLGEGETLPIFGVSHTVCHLKSSKYRVSCEEGRLILALPHPEDAAARIRAFWRFAAAEVEREMRVQTERYAPYFLPAGAPLPTITQRRMKGRWGSCYYTQNRINYNTNLIFAPRACLPYIACHELAHFKHPDHSAAFYDCLSRVLPDHKERRRLLHSTPLLQFISDT